MSSNECTALESKSARFFILDDGTPAPDVRLVLEYLNSVGRQAVMLALDDLAQRVQMHCDAYLRRLQPTCVVGVGEGGKQFLRFFTAQSNHALANPRFIHWSRLWADGKGVGFQSDLEDHIWKAHRVLLAEDVIASGETLEELRKAIAKLGGETVGVIAGAILGSSPWLYGSPVPTLVGLAAHAFSDADREADVDPHWFPPFFSFRHLFHGDREIEDFYERLSIAYFSGDPRFASLIRFLRGHPTIHRPS